VNERRWAGRHSGFLMLVRREKIQGHPLQQIAAADSTDGADAMLRSSANLCA
jgi:hypothetical protein